MNQLETRREFEEDEIDLMEVVRTLLKHKYAIGITTLVFTVVVVFGGLIYNKLNTHSTVTIGFNYPEIEVGKNPDGSTFYPENIISPSIVTSVYNENKEILKSRKKEDFRKSIEIESIIPKSIQNKIENALKNGEKVAYTPTHYKISTDESKNILNELIDKSIAEYLEKYKPNNQIALVENLDNYDYADIYRILNEKINILNNNIEQQEKKNYVSNTLNFSFDELKSNLQTLQSVELQDFYSYYLVNGFTKDIETKSIRTKNLISNLQLKKESLEEKSSTLKEILKEFRADNRQMVVPTLGEFGIKLNTENEHYTKLLDEYLELEDSAKETVYQIKLAQEELKKIEAPTEEEKNILAKKQSDVINKLNSIIEKYNTINEEYINSKYSDMIKVVIPVTEETEGKSTVIYLGMGIVLGGVLGVMIVFLKEFKKNYNFRFGK